uniref:Uncharacterized protein n=1 Tax=Ascaris lumbricoides TaxID=6252 RepID=A0A0M3IBS5_ASCLU
MGFEVMGRLHACIFFFAAQWDFLKDSDKGIRCILLNSI